MKLTDVTFRALLVGLCVALLLTVLIGWWAQATAIRGQAAVLEERSAIVTLRSLVSVVERIGLDEEEVLQRAMELLTSQDPALRVARVIRFQGIRLVASTAAEDAGETAAPRKMSRDEKPLYDLGQSLRASVESNSQEGRAWKEEIDVQSLPAGGLALAGPLEEDGRVVGALLVEAAPAVDTLKVGVWIPLAALLIPVFALLALRPLLANRRLMSLLIAAALVVVAAGIQGALGLGSIWKSRLAGETALAERLDAQEERIRSLLGELQLTAGPAVEPSSWDADRFRRPRKLVTPTGVEIAKVEESLAEDRASYWKLMTWIGVIALLVLGWIGLGGATRSGATMVRHRQAYTYVLPAMAGMILLVFFPFFYGIALSFTNSNVYNTDKPITEIWVGFENFVDILSDINVVKNTPEGRVFDYQNFYWTAGFTVIWTVTNVAIGVSVGLMLALILNTRGLALRPIYRVLFILPWAMPNYITALIWRGMFHSQFGVINQMIQMFGGQAISWFDTPFTAFITVISTNGWLSFPFMMVISLGALQSIPGDLYEAARVDGASKWQQFRTITLPSLKPALVPAVILSVVWTFNMFNVIYLVSAGEPGHSTEILITEAYKIAFEQYRYGYAAAYSVVIFLILLVYGVWQNRVTRATEGI